MTWLLIALVTVLTTAFVIYVFYLRPRQYSRYGTLEVPGEGTVELPAGEIGIFYEDNERWRFSDRPQIGDGFSLLIHDKAGATIHVSDPTSELVWRSGRKNRIPYGQITVSAPGKFGVVATLDEGIDWAQVTFGTPVDD